MNSYACTHPAKVQREGKGYCGIHDPVKKAARRAGTSRKWKADFDAKMKRGDERQRKLDTWDGLVAALEEIQVQTQDPAIERLCAAVLEEVKR